MILYAENDKIIQPQQKILLTDDIQESLVPSQKIILPEDSKDEEYNRREFMMFSLACMGMMAIPTQSKANPFLALAGGAYSFIKFIKHSRGLYKIYKEWKKLRKIKIPEIGIEIPNSYSVDKIVNVLNHSFGLAFSIYGIKKALEYFRKNPEYWDQEGYAKTKDGVLMNRAIVHLHNRTNRTIERKVRLMLVAHNKIEYRKQFTLSAKANEYGTFDVSEHFRKIHKKGLKKFKYDVMGNYKDVEVRSTNKNIAVSNLLA